MEGKKQLPKAKLIDIVWHRNRLSNRFMKFRGANFASVWIGPLEINWRMPWIRDVAENLHPECFSESGRK